MPIDSEFEGAFSGILKITKHFLNHQLFPYVYFKREWVKG